MLTKDFSMSVKDVGEDGVFEGYASTFGGAPDSYGDVIMPGAFTASLVRHKRSGSMPLMLWNHKAADLPIGNWLDMAEDGKGLWAKGQIDVEDAMGVRVHRAMKRKALRGLSIGYETLASETDPKKPGIEFLKEIELFEVSPVNFPANTRATITDVKSILADGNLPTVRQFEEHLRDAGFSKSLAAAIAAKATPHLRGEPEAKADDLAEFFRVMRTG